MNGCTGRDKDVEGARFWFVVVGLGFLFFILNDVMKISILCIYMWTEKKKNTNILEAWISYSKILFTYRPE